MSKLEELKPNAAVRGILPDDLTVGFALTILQRRLASSPEAIYQSLRRRRERLEKKLRELGFVPTDRETEKLGYDIESRIPGTGKLWFIEVK